MKSHFVPITEVCHISLTETWTFSSREWMRVEVVRGTSGKVCTGESKESEKETECNLARLAFLL